VHVGAARDQSEPASASSRSRAPRSGEAESPGTSCDRQLLAGARRRDLAPGASVSSGSRRNASGIYSEALAQLVAETRAILGSATSTAWTHALCVSDEPREVRSLVGSGSIEALLQQKRREEREAASDEHDPDHESEPEED
jgi:hypothetical protein